MNDVTIYDVKLLPHQMQIMAFYFSWVKFLLFSSVYNYFFPFWFCVICICQNSFFLLQTFFSFSPKKSEKAKRGKQKPRLIWFALSSTQCIPFQNLLQISGSKKEERNQSWPQMTSRTDKKSKHQEVQTKVESTKKGRQMRRPKCKTRTAQGGGSEGRLCFQGLDIILTPSIRNLKSTVILGYNEQLGSGQICSL